MALWQASNLLDMTQELVGEPVGGFYNISQRLAHMSQAQRALVDESNALSVEATITTTSGIASYDLPTGFLHFGKHQPVATPVSLSSPQTPVEVAANIFMDQTYPGWRNGNQTGTPRYLVQEGGSIYLYPTPDSTMNLHFNYVPDPNALVGMDDVPFNGRDDLNRYGPALAYHAAFIHLLPRAPQLAQMMQNLYTDEEKKMRHFVRTNPQKPQRIYMFAPRFTGGGANDGQGPLGGGVTYGGDYVVYGGDTVTYG